jgi:8-oxo-dGTP pyrophosphatase MutT (NUDIX family)
VIDPDPQRGTCTAWYIPAGGIRFSLERGSHASSPAIDRAWDVMTRANPRLFDGPFLSVERWSPPGAELMPGFGPSPPGFVCRVERYRRLAVAPVVAEAASVRLLALTGVVTARDGAGVEHVLMGLRSEGTRMYGGRWEFAPAGGVDPPAPGQTFDGSLLRRVLARELEEEVGLAPESMGACEPVLVVLNEEAHSYDVVMRTRLLIGVEEAALRAQSGSWEYQRVEWVPVDAIRGFADEEGLVPQGMAILDRLEW